MQSGRLVISPTILNSFFRTSGYRVANRGGAEDAEKIEWGYHLEETLGEFCGSVVN